MSYKQAPLGSGFGPLTTTTEVLAGRDLTGTVAIVTGGHFGLGLETTRALAAAGAHVVVGARQPAAARDALASLPTVDIDKLDLSDLSSVREFAKRFIDSGRHADIVINNAGIMACPETRVSPGWEIQFATNHLGHYALVNELWPALAGGAGARVVAVSSAGHHISGIRWEDVQFDSGYDKWQAYGQAKTANALFALHLDTLGKNEGVRAFSLDPGKIFTPLQRHLTKEDMVDRGWIDTNGNPADPTFKTTQQGAATQVWAATSPQLRGLGGLYCQNCDVAPPAEDDKATFAGVRSYASDPDQAARLWALSAGLTGINAFPA
jgi:NAD(P)-dependent dehydrogenase (short-subunit alcohol dehydrogenase family)